MFRVLFILIVALALMFPTLAQDDVEQETEEAPVLTVKRGESEILEIVSAYLLQGEKVERSLRSDYFVTEGSLDLGEGSWSLVATDLGGDEFTTYMGTDLTGIDLELHASPSRCFRALDFYASNAFRITCPLRSLGFELRSATSISLMLLTKVIG